MKQYSMISEDTIYYHKLKNGKVRFLCSECCETWVGDNKELKAIQRSHLCPKCFTNIKKTSDREYRFDKFVLDETLDKIDYCYYGYALRTHIKNARVSCKMEKMFMIHNHKKYIRNYHLNGMNYKFSHDYVFNGLNCKEINTKWRETKSPNWRYYFDVKNGYQHNKYNSYKEYLSHLPYSLNIKSNQRYIIQNNLMNYRQIAFMVAFNLKSIKDISKFNRYMRVHDIGNNAFNHNLNEYDLKYLMLNDISVGTYVDYLDVCSKLGIKDKHPKNFAERDGEVNAIYRDQQEKEKNKKLAKKIKKIILPNTQFKVKNKNYYINGYKDINELLNDSKTFSNCIYNCYAEDYANRKTDLYRCIDSNDKLIACIEIHKGKIQQIMGNKNSKPKLYKQIRSSLIEMVGA